MSELQSLNNVIVGLPPNEPLSHAILEVAREEGRAGSVSLVELVTSYPWSFVFSAYCIFFLGFMCWILIGRLCIREWITDGEAVMDGNVISIFLEAGERLGIKREFIVIENAHVSAPLTCRILRPVIILPAGFTKGLSERELLSVTLHELSHVKRNDVAILSILSLIKALFSFIRLYGLRYDR